jgi:hypothetical protein
MVMVVERKGKGQREGEAGRVGKESFVRVYHLPVSSLLPAVIVSVSFLMRHSVESVRERQR